MQLRTAAPACTALVCIAGLAAQEPLPADGGDTSSAPTTDVAIGEWVGGDPWWTWTRATGNWHGWRDRWADSGVEIGGSYTVDWAAAFCGGLRQRDNVCTLLDANVALDLEQLIGLPRTLAYFDAYTLQGRDPSSDIGDIQGISNIQGDDVDVLAEAWLQTWIGDHLRVKFGKVDFNSEFAFCELAGEFIHPSAGISPTIAGAPTFPHPSTALNVFLVPNEHLYFGVGLFDGAGAIDGVRTGRHGLGGIFESSDSDDWFYVAEGGVAWTGGNRWGSGRVAIGAWWHTGEFPRFAGGDADGTQGFYVVADQVCWRENPTVAGDEQGIGVFASFGFTDDDVWDFGANAVFGVSWRGPLAGRDDDVFGLAVMHADLADPVYAQDETTFETFYKFQLTPSLSLKPGLQWVVDPSGDPTIDDALVGTLRIEINF